MKCPHGLHEGDGCPDCGGLARVCIECARCGGRCWRHTNTTVVVPPYTFRPFEPIDSTVHPVVISPAGCGGRHRDRDLGGAPGNAGGAAAARGLMRWRRPLRAMLDGAGSILDLAGTRPIRISARPRAARVEEALASDLERIGSDFDRVVSRPAPAARPSAAAPPDA
jgi:hypothetical protein